MIIKRIYKRRGFKGLYFEQNATLIISRFDKF